MNAKLPVFATVGLAFGSVFSRRVLLSGFFVKCFLAVMLYAELYHSLLALLNLSENLYFTNIAPLPSYFILAPFFIGIHRLVILGDDFPPNPFKEFFGKRNINFAVYGILFMLPAMILNLVTVQGMKYGLPDWIGLFGLFAIPYYIILLRVFIYFPFIAVDNRQTLSACWKLTRKSTWRLFGVAMIYGVILMTPIFLMMYILGLDKVLALVNYTPEVFSSVRNFLDMLYFNFMLDLFGFVFGAVFVAIISHAFIFFRKRGKSWV